MYVLALDAGSSSLKYALFEIDQTQERELLRGDDRVDRIVARLEERGIRPDAIGHRLVFGGPDHMQPERITDRVVADLEDLVAFDPLHVPVALETIRSAGRAFADAAQVACYDTAFHAGLPEVAKRFALPRELYPEIRRYGYHGLSYEYIVWKLGERARGRVVVAHLGNGASLAAIHNGTSIDTSMGLTPLGGLMMGTRSGDLDPGVILRLLRSHTSAESLADLLTDRSGLRGVSEMTSDMRDLVAEMSSSVPAAQAVGLFVFQARKWIGAMTAALGGIDRLVFTGGIGEHMPEIRSLICLGLGHLGIVIDESRNASSFDTISRAGASVGVEVIATNENLMIARHACALLSAG